MTDVSLSERLGDEFASGEADLENAAQLASIPSPGDDIPSLIKTVRALKQVVDVLTGVSGSVLDKAPTVREMLQDGTLVYVPSTGLSTGIPAFITMPDGATGGGYNDPRPVLGVPPTITELEAWGAFKTVVLTWAMVDYQNHAYVEVWRAVADNLSTAVLVGKPTANLYSDADVTVGQTYYYWVRAVNIENAIGAYNAVGGTMGALLRIGSVDLAALAVEAANLASGAVTGPKLAVGAIAVGTAAIENGAINNAMIGNAVIDSAKVSSLDAALISFGEMDGDRIAANSLHGDRITSNTILADKIAANTLTADRMATDLLSANNILTRGLTVRDTNGGIILAAGSAMSWSYVGLGKPIQYRVRACGFDAYQAGKPSSGVMHMDTGTEVAGVGNMYVVARFVRATGAFLSAHVYDTFNGGTSAAASMAGLLSGLTNSEVVVVYTWDEPYTNRLAGGLDTQMYRCGASPGVFGSSKLKVRGAYILIGVPGCGAGNGYELYAGPTNSSADAFVETTFTIQAGQVNVNGMSSQPFIDASNVSTYIASAAIGDAYIGNLNADKITAGTLNADRINANTLHANKLILGTVSTDSAADNAFTSYFHGGLSDNTIIQGNNSWAEVAVVTPNGIAWDGQVLATGELRCSSPGARIDVTLALQSYAGSWITRRQVVETFEASASIGSHKTYSVSAYWSPTYTGVTKWRILATATTDFAVFIDMMVDVFLRKK